MDSVTRLGTLLAREGRLVAVERDGRLLRVASLSGGGLSAAVVASASRSMHVAAISGVRRTAFCLLRDDVTEASVAEPVVWAVRRRRGLVRDPILGAERRLRVLGRVFVLESDSSPDLTVMVEKVLAAREVLWEADLAFVASDRADLRDEYDDVIACAFWAGARARAEEVLSAHIESRYFAEPLDREEKACLRALADRVLRVVAAEGPE